MEITIRNEPVWFPDPVMITPAQVKAEAERRILAIMPEYKQRNYLALGLEATVTYGADATQWPSDLQAAHAQAQSAWDQIKAIRLASNALEALNPIPQDYTDDKHWGGA